MKKRVMCVHTELVRDASVLYEGKEGKRSLETTEGAVAKSSTIDD